MTLCGIHLDVTMGDLRAPLSSVGPLYSAKLRATNFVVQCLFRVRFTRLVDDMEKQSMSSGAAPVRQDSHGELDVLLAKRCTCWDVCIL